MVEDIFPQKIYKSLVWPIKALKLNISSSLKLSVKDDALIMHTGVCLQCEGFLKCLKRRSKLLFTVTAQHWLLEE